MADSFDTELFIESVKKFREIWDTKYELYHDKNVKRAAWMKICGIFEPSFEEKSQKEKDEIGKYSLFSSLNFGFQTFTIYIYRVGSLRLCFVSDLV
jgi:hypothetical protein